MNLRVPAVALPLLVFVVAWLALSPYHTHLTASVEADFPHYAEQAVTRARDVRWNGFIPCGYPWLLARASAGDGDMFLAGRILSATGAAAVVALAYLIARSALTARAAAFVGTAVALNWLALQNGLLAGTDALWAALALAAVYLADVARSRGSLAMFAAAGCVLGLSYDLRYATLAVAAAVVLLASFDAPGIPLMRRGAAAGALVAGIVVGALPQLAIALRDTGNPLANHQAKNVWFGMHGEQDWILNWDRVPDDISLRDVVLAGPAEFLLHVARNAGQFVAQCVTAPFGYQPAVLMERPAAAAVCLAMAGVPVAFGWSRGTPRAALALWDEARRSVTFRLWAGAALAYGLAVSTTFWTPRFFLFVLPLAVIAAAIVARRVLWPVLGTKALAARAILIAFLVLLASHSVATWSQLLRVNQQPIDEVGTALAAGGLAPDDAVVTTTLQHYDVSLPFSFVQLSSTVRDFEDLQQALAVARAKAFLYEESRGPHGSYWSQLDALFDDPRSVPFLEPLYVRSSYPRLIVFRAL